MSEPKDHNDIPTFSEANGNTHSQGMPFFDPNQLAKGDLIDDFEILEEIGHGGMGVVFKAYEKSLRRIVALKVLHTNIASNPSVAKRFRREAVLAANLSHANIVPVFHIDENQSPRYFTMEFVQGQSIKEIIEKEGYFNFTKAISIILQACNALQYAHENKIIHRDIKPSNILLQNHLERVRITDFGIAQEITEKQDITGQIDDSTQTQESTAGTPGFMSPEQNLGEILDERTDIFSLGMTLYFMLTGKLAFQAKNRQQLVMAFQNQNPTPPSQINSEISEELDKIVLKMIAVRPEDRYKNCKAVSADLNKIHQFEDGAAISSQKVSKVSVPFRHRFLLTILIIFITGLIITTLVKWLQKPSLEENPPQNEAFRTGL